MASCSPTITVRAYAPTDEKSWLRCRALSFLGSQYYDDVTPRRRVLDDPSIALVVTSPSGCGEVVVGILDVEIDVEAATIDTIATHPDYHGRGVATALLAAALPMLIARDVTELDAWTREDVAANAWYERMGFIEKYRYMHVYLGDGDDASGCTTPEGLSTPVIGFMHGRIEDEVELRSRYARTYVCRQYVRPVLD